MTAPTPASAAPQPPPDPEPKRRRWRSRGGIIGAAVLAMVIVAGVAVALLLPGTPGARPAPPGADVGLLGETGELGPLRGPGRGADPLLGKDALLVGTLVSTGGGTLVVDVDGAARRTLRTDDHTRVRGGGASALSGLKPGDRVVLRISGAGDAATVASVMTPQSRVTGTVTAVSGDTATVTVLDGRRESVNIARLPQKPGVGDIVIITGTAPDGATVSADRVRVLPKAS